MNQNVSKRREIGSEQMETEFLFANIDWNLVPTITEEEAMKSLEEFLGSLSKAQINLRSNPNE